MLTIDEETWRYCPVCEGTAGIWNRPFEEVEAVWRDIVARWPDEVLQWVDRRARAQQRAKEGTTLVRQWPFSSSADWSRSRGGLGGYFRLPHYDWQFPAFSSDR